MKRIHTGSSTVLGRRGQLFQHLEDVVGTLDVHFDSYKASGGTVLFSGIVVGPNFLLEKNCELIYSFLLE